MTPALRRLAARILRNLGYEVLEAGSGVEAIAVWEKHGKKVNLLLTDLVMPDGLTGRELAKHMATREAGLKVHLHQRFTVPRSEKRAFFFAKGTISYKSPIPRQAGRGRASLSGPKIGARRGLNADICAEDLTAFGLVLSATPH